MNFFEEGAWSKLYFINKIAPYKFEKGDAKLQSSLVHIMQIVHFRNLNYLREGEITINSQLYLEEI